MKITFILFLALGSAYSHARVDMEKLAGSWQTECTQVQLNGVNGHVTEIYSFVKPDQFEFTRTWYKNRACLGESFKVDSELGQITIKELESGSIFNPKGTYKTEFSVNGEVDKGLVWISDTQEELRLSRGFNGGVQNSMLGIFKYKRM